MLPSGYLARRLGFSLKSGCSFSKAPGIDELPSFLSENDTLGISCGQCHSGWGLKPVEAIGKRNVLVRIISTRRGKYQRALGDNSFLVDA